MPRRRYRRMKLESVGEIQAMIGTTQDIRTRLNREVLGLACVLHFVAESMFCRPPTERHHLAVALSGNIGGYDGDSKLNFRRFLACFELGQYLLRSPKLLPVGDEAHIPCLQVVPPWKELSKYGRFGTARDLRRRVKELEPKPLPNVELENARVQPAWPRDRVADSYETLQTLVHPRLHDRGLRSGLGPANEVGFHANRNAEDQPNPQQRGGLRDTGLRATWPLDYLLEGVFQLWGRAAWMAVPHSATSRFRDGVEEPARKEWGVNEMRSKTRGQVFRTWANRQNGEPNKGWILTFDLYVIPLRSKMMLMPCSFFPTVPPDTVTRGCLTSEYRALWIEILNAAPDPATCDAIKDLMFKKFSTLKWAPGVSSQQWYGGGFRIVKNDDVVSMEDAGYRTLREAMEVDQQRQNAAQHAVPE